MAKQNREREFLVALKNSVKKYAPSAFWYKIPDAPIFAGQKTRFTGAKPFDALLLLNGVLVGIEAKYQPAYRAFGHKQLRPSQHEGLRAIREAGGRAFVFLNVRQVRTAEIKGFNRCLIFEYPMAGQYGKAALTEYPAIDINSGIFDLSEWLDGISAGWV